MAALITGRALAFRAPFIGDIQGLTRPETSGRLFRDSRSLTGPEATLSVLLCLPRVIRVPIAPLGLTDILISSLR